MGRIARVLKDGHAALFIMCRTNVLANVINQLGTKGRHIIRMTPD